MRASVRWFLIGVLAIDVIGAGLLLTGAIPVTRAADTGSSVQPQQPTASREVLEQLGRELSERTEALRRREAELDELMRAEEVERRLTALDEQRRQREVAEAESSDAPAGRAPERNPAFENLQRAYENMEPESAAAALGELASLDEEAVLQLLAGWKPRTSGQILDALTQTDPELAGRLSYRIWKLGGKNGAAAASNDR